MGRTKVDLNFSTLVKCKSYEAFIKQLFNYKPDESICWQIWCMDDFGDNINLDDWETAAIRFNFKYESDEGQYIAEYINDAKEKRTSADSEPKVGKNTKLKM